MRRGEKRRFTAAIFDLDGVIINSEPIHMDIINSMVKPYGDPFETKEYNERLVGKCDQENFQTVKEKYGMAETIDELIGGYKQRLSEYFETVLDLPVLPGVENLIKKLYQDGIKLAVASSSSNRNIRLSLQHSSLARYFDALSSAEDAQHGKPAPDVYLNACNALGVEATCGIAIEDSESGVLAAKAAGLYTIGFRNPDSGNQNLSAADRIVDTLEELMDFI